MGLDSGEGKVEGPGWPAIWGFKNSSVWPVTKWTVTAWVNEGIHHTTARDLPPVPR